MNDRLYTFHPYGCIGYCEACGGFRYAYHRNVFVASSRYMTEFPRDCCLCPSPAPLGEWPTTLQELAHG